MWIISINVEDPITYQGALNEINWHQTPRGKFKVKISLCRRKIYQRTDIEDICSRFHQVRPVISHIEVRLTEKPLFPNISCESLKDTQRQFWKEDLFLQY